MTIQWGDTGRVAYGSLKKYTLAMATPRETLFGTTGGAPFSTPQSLPSTEPGTPQISFTLSAGDLPNISPSPISVVYTPFVIIGGKNTDAASQTINYRVLKNGTSVMTGTSSAIASNNFWTYTCDNFYGAVVGDTLSISLWSASANVNYDYYALMVFPTRMQLGKAAINKSVSYAGCITPTLTVGTPQASPNNFLVYIAQPGNINTTIGGDTTFPLLGWDSTYQSCRFWNGDFNQNMILNTSTTKRPFHLSNIFPSTISFREVLR